MRRGVGNGHDLPLPKIVENDARIEPAAVFAGTALFDYITEPGQTLVCARNLARTLIERNDKSLPLIRQRAVVIAGAAEVLTPTRAQLERDSAALVLRQARDAARFCAPMANAHAKNT